MALNSSVITPKSTPNQEQIENCREERCKRGPYKAYQAADAAVMSIEAAKGKLVEIIKCDRLTPDEILRHVSLALVWMGDGVTSVKESTQAVKDYVANSQVES